MYCPASFEAALFDKPLHGDVVIVGVYAYIAVIFETLIYAEGSCAPALSPFCRSDPVDHSIFRIIEPGTVLNTEIGRVQADKKHKHTGYVPGSGAGSRHIKL